MVGETAHQILSEAGLRVPKPEGGFYLFPDASALSEKLKAKGVDTSEKLCEKLLTDTGVAVLPGSDFGRSPNELTFRLATVNFDGEAALENVADFKGTGRAFVESYCPDLLQALNLMAQWLHS